uniref:Uncharacterized protein n=1 Tax=Encephalitozoon cuniculi TaxID=6035 RepID=M1K828_ENCCN|nr:hypothetical protein ECU08_1320 [Encephalitozoon cuniculi]
MKRGRPCKCRGLKRCRWESVYSWPWLSPYVWQGCMLPCLFWDMWFFSASWCVCLSSLCPSTGRSE